MGWHGLKRFILASVDRRDGPGGRQGGLACRPGLGGPGLGPRARRPGLRRCPRGWGARLGGGGIRPVLATVAVRPGDRPVRPADRVREGCPRTGNGGRRRATWSARSARSARSAWSAWLAWSRCRPAGPGGSRIPGPAELLVRWCAGALVRWPEGAAGADGACLRAAGPRLGGRIGGARRRRGCCGRAARCPLAGLSARPWCVRFPKGPARCAVGAVGTCPVAGGGRAWAVATVGRAGGAADVAAPPARRWRDQFARGTGPPGCWRNSSDGEGGLVPAAGGRLLGARCLR